MSTTPITPAPPAPPKPASSHPTTIALAPYLLTAIVVAGVVVLLALSKISEQSGVGILGVIVGGHLANAFSKP